MNREHRAIVYVWPDRTWLAQVMGDWSSDEVKHLQDSFSRWHDIQPGSLIVAGEAIEIHMVADGTAPKQMEDILP